jgi:hypothetical protein
MGTERGDGRQSPAQASPRNQTSDWRIVRYADDFVVLTDGERDDVEALLSRRIEDIADVLQPLGLRLSEAKTQVVHMSDGFGFLGFRIQWRRKRGTDKWHVYTFIADRPIRQPKDKIRALTNRTSQQNPRDVLIMLNQIMRDWANYFKHAVCKATLSSLASFTWHRVIIWWMALHRWKWKDVRRRLTDHTGRWQGPRQTGSNCSTSARWRSLATATETTRSPTPGPAPTTPERQSPWRARYSETGTPGSASGTEKRTSGNAGTALRADSTGTPQAD